jgi:hypothetical protein
MPRDIVGHIGGELWPWERIEKLLERAGIHNLDIWAKPFRQPRDCNYLRLCPWLRIPHFLNSWLTAKDWSKDVNLSRRGIWPKNADLISNDFLSTHRFPSHSCFSQYDRPLLNSAHNRSALPGLMTNLILVIFCDWTQITFAKHSANWAFSHRAFIGTLIVHFDTLLCLISLSFLLLDFPLPNRFLSKTSLWR